MSRTLRLARRAGIGPNAYEQMRRGMWLFAMVTVASAAFDLFTKWWAVERLSKLGLVSLTDRLGLHLVFNHGTAGGLSVGEHTLLFNIVVMSAVLLVVTGFSIMLSGIDSWSPIAFGMIAGGGWGNLASVIGGPSGVPDFLAWQADAGGLIVFNVADVVLWTGCLALLPIAARLATRYRGDSIDLRAFLAR